MSEFANTLRAMAGAVQGARLALLDELTVEQIQRHARGQARSDETVSAALRAVDKILRGMQEAYEEQEASFRATAPAPQRDPMAETPPLAPGRRITLSPLSFELDGIVYNDHVRHVQLIPDRDIIGTCRHCGGALFADVEHEC